MSAKQLHSELISNMLARTRNEQCRIAHSESLKCRRCGDTGVFKDFPTARWLPCDLCGRGPEVEWRCRFLNGEAMDYEDEIPF